MWAVLQAIKRSWFKHIVTQLSALFILTATYAVALFIILSTNNIKNIFNIWGKVSEASIYLKNDVQTSQLKILEKYLSNHKLVKSFNYESSIVAAKHFNEKFKDMAAQNMDPENISQFFPSTYKIKFNNEYSYKNESASIDSFVATLGVKYEFIKEVSYGKSWLSRYEKVIIGIETTSWLIVTIILLASLFVSSNVIKTVLFSKKEEIEIFEFVGAETSWIYSPHIINVCLLSVLSFVSAVLINYGIFQFSYSQFSLVVSDMIINEVKFLSLDSIIFYLALTVAGVGLYSVFGISTLMPKNKKKYDIH